VYFGNWTTRSGLPIAHSSPSANCRWAGMSAGLPRGAPASIHATIVSISLSASERLFLNSWMPTLRSMCHGGISRAETRVLIERAHGRTSS